MADVESLKGKDVEDAASVVYKAIKPHADLERIWGNKHGPAKSVEAPLIIDTLTHETPLPAEAMVACARFGLAIKEALGDSHWPSDADDTIATLATQKCVDKARER